MGASDGSLTVWRAEQQSTTLDDVVGPAPVASADPPLVYKNWRCGSAHQGGGGVTALVAAQGRAAGAAFVSGGNDHLVRLWDGTTGELLSEVLTDASSLCAASFIAVPLAQAAVAAGAFGGGAPKAACELLFAASESGGVRVWDVQSGTMHAVLHHALVSVSSTIVSSEQCMRLWKV